MAQPAFVFIILHGARSGDEYWVRSDTIIQMHPDREHVRPWPKKSAIRGTEIQVSDGDWLFVRETPDEICTSIAQALEAELHQGRPAVP